MLALREQPNIHNAVFCEESFGNDRKRCRSFSEWVGPRITLLESLPQISKVHVRPHEITNEPCTSSNYENTDKK